MWTWCGCPARGSCRTPRAASPRPSAEYEIPIGFGLLTTDTMEQAEARAGGEHGNKGWDAAVAAMEMADLFERLDGADAG